MVNILIKTSLSDLQKINELTIIFHLHQQTSYFQFLIYLNKNQIKSLSVSIPALMTASKKIKQVENILQKT